MSLYNSVMRWAPMAPIALAILGVRPSEVARFRDAWTSDDGYTVTLLTRTGGGNRREYEEDNERLRALPRYTYDRDDAFDSTFALFFYATPEDLVDDVRTLARFCEKTGQGADTRGPEALKMRLSPEWAKRETPEMSPDEIRAAEEAWNRLATKLERTGS